VPPDASDRDTASSTAVTWRPSKAVTFGSVSLTIESKKSERTLDKSASQFPEYFGGKEHLWESKFIFRAHFDRLAFSVEMQMSVAPNNLDERIDDRGKYIRIDPCRFDGGKRSRFEFHLRLYEVISIDAAFP
jgi:hypothetical protein